MRRRLPRSVKVPMIIRWFDAQLVPEFIQRSRFQFDTSDSFSITFYSVDVLCLRKMFFQGADQVIGLAPSCRSGKSVQSIVEFNRNTNPDILRRVTHKNSLQP